jgi:peroxiredoxin
MAIRLKNPAYAAAFMEPASHANDIIPCMKMNCQAPDFALHDLDGNVHRLSDYRNRIVIVNFWSCDCPHAARTDRTLISGLSRWGKEVVLLPVAANRAESIEDIRVAALERHLPTVLLDRDQTVTNAYEAQTTPHVYVVDRIGDLRYRGAVDDVHFGRRQPTRVFIEEVIEALLEDRAPSVLETPAFGCTIIREAVE